MKNHGVPGPGHRYYTPYVPAFCDQLVKHMSSGHSFQSFGGIAKVSRETLTNWVEKYPEFAEAKKIGYGAWLNFIETILLSRTTGKELINGVNPKNIDIAGAIFMLKTVGSSVFYEKKELEIIGGSVITLNYKMPLEETQLLDVNKS